MVVEKFFSKLSFCTHNNNGSLLWVIQRYVTSKVRWDCMYWLKTLDLVSIILIWGTHFSAPKHKVSWTKIDAPCSQPLRILCLLMYKECINFLYDLKDKLLLKKKRRPYFAKIHFGWFYLIHKMYAHKY